MKIKLLTLLCFLSFNAFAGQDRGGGDMCENRIKVIRDDILDWINRGGADNLDLPQEITLTEYKSSMLREITKAKIKCVGEKDPGYPVEINGVPKVCRFDIISDKSFIKCDIDKFTNLDESEQYELIHHEYAGLAGLENPTEEDSHYTLSNQISAYLVDTVVKKLAIKPAGCPDCSSESFGGKYFFEKAKPVKNVNEILSFYPLSSRKGTHIFVSEDIRSGEYPYNVMTFHFSGNLVKIGLDQWRFQPKADVMKQSNCEILSLISSSTVPRGGIPLVMNGEMTVLLKSNDSGHHRVKFRIYKSEEAKFLVSKHEVCDDLEKGVWKTQAYNTFLEERYYADPGTFEFCEKN